MNIQQNHQPSAFLQKLKQAGSKGLLILDQKTSELSIDPKGRGGISLRSVSGAKKLANLQVATAFLKELATLPEAHSKIVKDPQLLKKHYKMDTKPLTVKTAQRLIDYWENGSVIKSSKLLTDKSMVKHVGLIGRLKIIRYAKKKGLLGRDQDGTKYERLETYVSKQKIGFTFFKNKSATKYANELGQIGNHVKTEVVTAKRLARWEKEVTDPNTNKKVDVSQSATAKWLALMMEGQSEQATNLKPEDCLDLQNYINENNGGQLTSVGNLELSGSVDLYTEDNPRDRSTMRKLQDKQIHSAISDLPVGGSLVFTTTGTNGSQTMGLYRGEDTVRFINPEQGIFEAPNDSKGIDELINKIRAGMADVGKGDLSWSKVG